MPLFCGWLVGWSRENEGLKALRGSGRIRKPPDAGRVGPRRDPGMGQHWSCQSILASGSLALLHIEQMLQDLRCLQPPSDTPLPNCSTNIPWKTLHIPFFLCHGSVARPHTPTFGRAPPPTVLWRRVAADFPSLLSGTDTHSWKGWVRRRSWLLSAPQEPPGLTWN